MSAGGDQGRLQQVAAQMEEIDQVIDALQAQVQQLRTRRAEIEAAIDAIGTLDDGDEVQVPLGGGAYVHSTIEDLDGVIVEIGGGYAAERGEADAIELLEAKAERIQSQIDEATEAIADLEAQGDELSAQAQQEYAELAARQQGAAGGAGGPDLGGNG